MGTFYKLEIRSQGRRKEVWRLRLIREVRKREIHKVKIDLRCSGNFRAYKPAKNTQQIIIIIIQNVVKIRAT